MPRNADTNRRAAGRLLLPLGLLLAVLLAACAQVRLPDSAPDIISFTAQPTALTAGETSTLAWEVEGADTVVLHPSGDRVDDSGTRSVSPETTTDYTLVATNRRGETRETITIHVRQPEAPPVIGTFTARPAEIARGEQSDLIWDVAGADTITISPEIGNVPEAAGSQAVEPASTTTYRLTASNAWGATAATATVTVTGSGGDGDGNGDGDGKDGRPFIAEFTASPEGINAGESSTLTWTVEGATSVSIHPQPGDVDHAGSTRVTPASTTTYTLRAVNDKGVSTRSVTVYVRTSPDSAPLVTRFSATPSRVERGGTSTLSWSVVGANSVSISPDIGAVSASGSRTVQVDRDITYTLTATNSSGTARRTAAITVNGSGSGSDPADSVNAVFLADPASGPAPLATTFHWVISDPNDLVTDVELHTGSAGASISGLSATHGSHDHTYTDEGTYTARLTLLLSDGSTIQRSTTVGAGSGQPGSVPPTIDRFGANPSSGTAPLNATFSWKVSGGTGLICTIDPGDGSAPQIITSGCGTGEFTHSYNTPGAYIASLTVQDEDGNTVDTATAVAVFPAGGGSRLIADFTAEPTEGMPPLNTDFRWQLNTPADTWLFFGDGSTPHEGQGKTGSLPHEYTGTGTFRAVLLALDSDGNTDIAVIPIRVQDEFTVPTAIVRTGSTLLSLNEDERGLLAPLLGTLVPGGAGLTVLDNQALLDTEVNLLGLLEAAAVKAGRTGPEAVLLGAIDLTDAIDGLLDLLTGTAAAAPLQELLGALPTQALPVRLGDLIRVPDPEDLTALRELDVQVLDVLVLLLQLFNSENVAATPDPIEIGLTGTDGLLDVLGLDSLVTGSLDSGSLARVYLQVVEPPVLTFARVDRLGNPDASFRSAGVRLAVELDGLGVSVDLDGNSTGGLLDGILSLVTGLLNTFGLVGVDADLNLTLTELAVFAEIGSFDGYVSDLDPESKRVTVQSAGSVASLALGKVNPGVFFDRSRRTPVDADHGIIADAELKISARLLGSELAGANAHVVVKARANTRTSHADGNLVLRAPFPKSGSVPSHGAGALIDGLLGDLDIELDVDLSTSGALSRLLGLNNLLNPLRDLLTDVLNSVLGLGSGATDLGAALPLDGLLHGLLDNTVFRVLGVNLNETEVTVLDLVIP